MKTKFSKWMSIAIIITTLFSLLPAWSVSADTAPRITITSPAAETDPISGKPVDDNLVPRLTNNPITVSASIQNITDSQIADIYYEITNINTGATITESGNPAAHAPGSFSLAFNNVILTEGLNKITIKMGKQNITSSSPTWAYFTPTTTITNLKVNGTVDFDDTKSYPTNPTQNSAVTISGSAPNATSVEVTVGNSPAKPVFLNNGVFFFTGDGKSNSTANFKLNPGDNPITIVAKNNGKSYQVKKNLIYDNGNPFAFDAKLSTKTIEDAGVAITGSGSGPFTSPDLLRSDVAPGTVEVWTATGKTGTKITGFTVLKSANPGKSYLEFATDPTVPVYITYGYNKEALTGTPTTNTTDVEISAKLKSDLTPQGTLKYRYVDVFVGGTRFGPYDLNGAAPATTVSSIFPKIINGGHSDTSLSLIGTGLNSSVTISIENKSGANILTPAASLSPTFVNSNHTVALYTIPQDSIKVGLGPYTVTVQNGASALNTFSINVNNAGIIKQVVTPIVVEDAVNSIPLKKGYAPTSKQKITLTGNYSNADAALLRIDVMDLMGKNILLSTNATSITGSGPTDFIYDFQNTPSLNAGDYKILVKYDNIELAQGYFTIDPAAPTVPAMDSIAAPLTIPMINAPTYLIVNGSNLGTTLSNITKATLLDSSSSPAGMLSPYFISDTTAVFQLADQSVLSDGEIYDLEFELNYKDAAGALTLVTLKADDAFQAKDLTGFNNYAGESVVGMAPYQIDQASIASTNITVTGSGLLLPAKMPIMDVMSSNGKTKVGSATLALNDLINGTWATFKLPSLTVGSYYLRFAYNNNVLAWAPLTISKPSLGNISPIIKSSSAVTPTAMTVTGTGFGIDASKLQLQFTSDATGLTTVQNVLKYATGFTASTTTNIAGVSAVAPRWNTGPITIPPASSTRSLVFLGTTVNISTSTVAAPVDIATLTALNGDITIVNNSNASTTSQAIINALNEMRDFGPGPLTGFRFSLNSTNNGILLIGPLTAGSTLNNSVNFTLDGSTLGVTYNTITAALGQGGVKGVNPIKADVTTTIGGSHAADGYITATITGAGLPAGGITTDVINVVSGNTPTDIADAIASSLNNVLPNYNYIAASQSTNTIDFTQSTAAGGTPFNLTINDPSALEAGNKAMFNLPTFPQGTYAVNLLYNGAIVGSSIQYTVSPPPATLQELGDLSVPNSYKVFDFAAALQIPTSRYGQVKFKFYSFSTDDVPTTDFSYGYVDESLPYIDHTLVGTTQQLNEVGSNEINEMPNSLQVFTDTKTKKINVYLGNYSGSSTPYFSSTAVPSTQNIGSILYNVFTVPLTAIPNGQTNLIIVPSDIYNAVGPLKQGENLSGKVSYSVNITSTPYIIMTNIYNGMVVKDQISEINCNFNGSAGLGRCLQGRLVNIPIVGSTWPTEAKVEIYLNGTKTDLVNPGDFDDQSKGLFHVYLNSGRGGELVEGRNTIKVMVYLAGKLVSQSSYDIFVFSEESPEFLSIKPVETTDIPKFIARKQVDGYSTAETAVTLKGQFANASEVKLTVRQTLPDGTSSILYDRRLSDGVTIDPVNGPNYFNSIDFSTGIFETNPINLALKGDTIFEFTIVNQSVTRTRAITITREPLPYVILYPVLTKNAKGASQANINSNYIEVEMLAEGADSVTFAKNSAVKRTVTDINGNPAEHYFYEIKDLKAGSNNISFTVNRGTESLKGSFILFNADTPLEGAQFKTALKSSVSVFNGLAKLTFPKGTSLMRNDPAAIDQFLSTDRSILFGIASDIDGRVDKYKNPSVDDGQLGNPYETIDPFGVQQLAELTGRFKAASKRIWTDAGTIVPTDDDRTKALTGGGRLPYDKAVFWEREPNDEVVPTKRGSLTLKYDAAISNDAWKYLTVFHYEKSEDYTGAVLPKWRNIGGVVDSTNHTITVPFESFGYYQVMFMDQSFDDITSHPWARNQLDTLYSKGIMLNETDSSFVPNDPIKRAEFTTLLVKVLDLPLLYTKDESTFSDVLPNNPLTNGLYDYRYIETAARAGIIRGSGGGRFDPESSITRQDAASIISRAINLKVSSDTDKSLVTLQKLYTDANSIDVYARAAVEAVSKATLIVGKENVLLQGQKKSTFRFDPDQTFTRAEAAEVIIRVLKQQKKIPK